MSGNVRLSSPQPNSMGIDPSDEKCVPFYEKMKKLDMVSLCQLLLHETKLLESVSFFPLFTSLPPFLSSVPHPSLPPSLSPSLPLSSLLKQALLVHSGHEHSVDAAFLDNRLGNPLLLRKCDVTFRPTVE